MKHESLTLEESQVFTDLPKRIMSTLENISDVVNPYNDRDYLLAVGNDDTLVSFAIESLEKYPRFME